MRWLIYSAMISLLLHGILLFTRFDLNLSCRKAKPPQSRSVVVSMSYHAPEAPPAPKPEKPVLPVKKKKKPSPRKIIPKEKPIAPPVEPIPSKPEKTVEPDSATEEVAPEDTPAPAPEEPAAEPSEKEASAARVIHEASPLYRDNPPPRYPRVARRRGYQGTVILNVLVTTDGTVKELLVKNSSGYEALDHAAVDSVRNWLFTPGMRGEQPIEMWVSLPVTFRLK